MANDIRSSQEGEIILYQPNDDIKLEVKLEDDTVWLTQQQMTELFQTSKQNVSLHINNIFREGELDRELVVKESLTTTKHGAMTGKVQQKRVLLYNLDVIISVGYRVKSQRGTQFRIWATKVLREYLLRGYTIHPQLQKVEYHLSRQISDQNDRIYALEQKIQNQQQQVDFLVNIHRPDKEKLFPTGCVFDAWEHISALVRTATHSITLIDNYCDERTLLILAKRNTGVECTIHTRFSDSFNQDLEKHNQQYPAVKMVQLPHREHDRFLIIDDKVYILGDSLKNIGHSMTAVLKTSFTPEDILCKLK